MKNSFFACAMALVLLFGVGCTNKRQLLNEYSDAFDAVRFDFEKIGYVVTKAGKGVKTHDLNWNRAEIWADLIQKQMKERGLTVGQVIPARLGLIYEEIKLEGRTLGIEVGIIQDTAWFSVSIPEEGKDGAKTKTYKDVKFNLPDRGDGTEEEYFELYCHEVKPFINHWLDILLGEIQAVRGDDF